MATTILSASGLSFAYRSDAPVLREVGLELKAGEVVALLGPNASGKSTLLRVLLGQLDATGQIAWEERPAAQWGRRELARRVAYLPQSPTYEPLQTVADVLRLGRAAYWSAFGIESSRDAEIVSSVARQHGGSEWPLKPSDCTFLSPDSCLPSDSFLNPSNPLPHPLDEQS